MKNRSFNASLSDEKQVTGKYAGEGFVSPVFDTDDRKGKIGKKTVKPPGREGFAEQTI